MAAGLSRSNRIVALIVIALTAAGCGSTQEDGGNGSNGIDMKVTDVKVKTLTPQTFVDYIEVTGTVNADVATTISAEEAGVVQRFLKEKGDWVNREEVIVALKSEILQASYEEARAVYQLSKATFERQANLYKDQVISEQKYLEYKYGLERDKARLDNLRARLQKTRIKSPVAGYFDSRFVEVGEFVQPGTPLVKVVKTDVVKVAAGVPERFVQDVELGSHVEISFDVLHGEVFSGRITFVGPGIDRSSRTFPIEVKLQNESRKLKPEMFAKVRIRKSEVTNAIVVPRDAIIETEDGKFVFVSNSMIARKREIEISGAYENRIWIKDGLQAGDRLIIVGHRELVDGERIAIHD